MINYLISWIKHHKVDFLVISLLVMVSGIVSSANMAGYPQRFEDEGTYVSQAYAIEEKHTLTHYTYWYDHPPAGWIQIAGYTTLTNAFHRNVSSISAGREFMLALHLISIVLLYALARRFGIGFLAAGLGVLLYALSPLSIEFSRYVFLDNVALPWLLGAFLLALSPRRSLAVAIGSAVCLAVAILSKETLIILAPIVPYLIWHNGDERNRRYMITSFGVVFFMLTSTYILYAVLKNELLPGAGHVSLLGTLFWQLFGRAGSGSILNPNSPSRGLVKFWLDIDPWLLIAGTIALPVSLKVKRLRPVGLALLIGLLLIMRGGYLPYPYVIALLPFASLTIAGAIQYLIIHPVINKVSGYKANTLKVGYLAVCMGLIVMFISVITPQWHSKIHAMTTKDYDASSRQAVAWISHNISHRNRLVVESALWTDLQNKGFDKPQPVWLYKTETDPAVTKVIGGWRGIDYVVLNGPTISQNSARNFPTVYAAIAHSKIAAEFGKDAQKIVIYKVKH